MPTSVFLAALLALTTPASTGDVLVVDASGGGAFTNLQPAVDAASDGDTILVKPGAYGAAVVVSKGLAIVADPDATVIGGLRFENTLEFHEILVSGLTLRGVKPPGDGLGVPALDLSVVRGPVRIENCTLRGAAPSSCDTSPPLGACAGGPAARVRFASDAAFVHCEIRGGDGVAFYEGGEHDAGGHGMLVTGASVSLHDTVVHGGDGGTAVGTAYLDEGGHGGDGIRGTDTPTIPLFVSFSGSVAQGGVGGNGELCICKGGDGGDGVHLIGPTAALSTLDSFLGGGPPGCGGNNPVPGLPLRLEMGAAASALPGVARTLIGPNVVREGALRTLVALGQPGDLVVLRSASLAGFQFWPMWSGVILLGNPSLQSMRVLGVVPATGVLIQNLVAPALPVGVDSATLYHQGFVRDTSGASWLTGSWTELSLDSSF